MRLLEAARRIQGIYGKPAGHVFVPCFHPTTQEGGEGCHRFMSCHEHWPERCEFWNYEHCTEGDPMLSMPKIVAALEAAAGFVQSQQGIGYMDAGRFHTCIAYDQWQALVAALKDGPA